MIRLLYETVKAELLANAETRLAYDKIKEKTMIQGFCTREDAQKVSSQLRGWEDIEVACVFVPEHPLQRGGYVWVIRANQFGEDAKFLHEDGYVR